MVYNGLGEGTVVQRNKNRINYVKELSKDTSKLQSIINELFNSLDEFDKSRLNKMANFLFFERIDEDYINDLMELHRTFDTNTINDIKESVLHNCINRSTKGFIWNLFNEYNKRK